MKKPQLWFCEECATLGVVQYEEHEDAVSVVFRMGDLHDKESPDCGRSSMRLRCIVPENLKKDEVIHRFAF